MLKRLIIAAAFMASATHAMAVGPTITFQTDTTAIAEGLAATQSDAGSAVLNPLVTTSTVVGTTDFASGAGIATAGLLSTSAEADSMSGFASAVGSSRYLATFSGGTVLAIHFTFASLDSTDASSYSQGSVYLHIANGGVTVWDEAITTSGTFDRRFTLSGTGDQTVDFLLTSVANTTAGGSGFNSSNLSFDVSPVPEPATWLLCLIGMAALLVKQRASVRARP